MNGFLERRRGANALAALCCFGLLGYALYSQSQGYTPCPLCIFQRVGVAALGVAFVLALVPGDRQLVLRRICALLVLAVALATAGVAARHYYIQHLPPGLVPVCGATLDYMMEVFSPGEVLRKVLTGSGECAKVDWTFLGLSMPGWVFIWSLGLGGLGLAANWRRPVSGG